MKGETYQQFFTFNTNFLTNTDYRLSKRFLQVTINNMALCFLVLSLCCITFAGSKKRARYRKLKSRTVETSSDLRRNFRTRPIAFFTNLKKIKTPHKNNKNMLENQYYN